MYLFKPIILNSDLQVAVLVFHPENGTWIKAGLSLIPKMAQSVRGPSEVVPPPSIIMELEVGMWPPH